VERTNFVNLRVYQLAEGLADDIWDVVARWNQFARDTVGKQMVRAADSISANIAEGSGRGGVVENRRFVKISRGSMYETRNWLRRSFRRKLLTSKQVQSLSKSLDELTLTLNGYLRSLKDKPEN
jgi:four helix bundle protein